MPNRILRDWTDSEIIDQLTVHSERFFTRLIMKVDDYGRYTANIKILRSTLFPLRTDIRETDITRWIAECEKSGLIVLYNITSKSYLQINNFKQTLRQKHQKYPSPDDSEATCYAHATQMNSICVPETKRNETETESGNGSALQAQTQEQINLFNDFQKWLNKTAPRVNKLKEPLTIEEYFKLRQKVSKEVLTKVLIAMQNRNDLLKRYVSAYLTILNWSKREDDPVPKIESGVISINEKLKKGNGSH